MIDLELCYLPATEALRRFKNKRLSPVELLQAMIDRAEATADSVNALTFTHFDEAMALARKAEQQYANGKRTGALAGLPIGIKDESYIEGKPTSNGSLTMKDFIAPTTSVNNERILRAGGIVHARTATPEFSCAGYTHSRLWGITRNPWNPEFTPGGSSGGSAASLACGSSAIATGSDIGGSIRIPAAACGLVGYKPPYGRNCDDPPFNLDFYCHTGPLARNVGDAVLLQNVLCGPHPTDIASLRPKLRLPTTYKPINDWKIGYSMDLGFFEVDTDVEKNTLEALSVFRDLGAQVHHVEIDWTADILDAAGAYLDHLFAASLSGLLDTDADALTPYARAFLERGRESQAVDFVESLTVVNTMYASFGPMLEQCDVFVCPTNALPAVKADFDQSKDTVEINGKLVNPMLGWFMTTPFNMLSRCPVLTMPTGFAGNGVPTSIQLIGKTYRDQDVFRAAFAYETAAGEWFTRSDLRPTL